MGTFIIILAVLLWILWLFLKSAWSKVSFNIVWMVGGSRSRQQRARGRRRR